MAIRYFAGAGAAGEFVPEVTGMGNDSRLLVVGAVTGGVTAGAVNGGGTIGGCICCFSCTAFVKSDALPAPQQTEGDNGVFGRLGQKIARAGTEQRVRRAAAERQTSTGVLLRQLHQHKQNQRRASDDQEKYQYSG